MNHQQTAQLSPSQKQAYQRMGELITNQDSLIAVRAQGGNVAATQNGLSAGLRG